MDQTGAQGSDSSIVACQLLHVADLQVDVASLPRGLHARCVAFHPTRPLLAVVGR
jgi:hypothetical protein